MNSQDVQDKLQSGVTDTRTPLILFPSRHQQYRKEQAIIDTIPKIFGGNKCMTQEDQGNLSTRSISDPLTKTPALNLKTSSWYNSIFHKKEHEDSRQTRNFTQLVEAADQLISVIKNVRSRDEVIRHTCRILVHAGVFRSAAVIPADRKQNILTGSRVEEGDSQGDILHVLENKTTLSGLLTAIRRRGAVYPEDCVREYCEGWDEGTLRGIQERTTLIIPLEARSCFFGLLIVTSKLPKTISWAERSLLAGYAGTVALFLHCLDSERKKKTWRKLCAGKPGNLLEQAFNAMSGGVVILNEDGISIDSNDAWRSFVTSSGLPWNRDLDYPRFWKSLEKETENTDTIAEGIREVLEGKHDTFTGEYFFQGQSGKWIQIRITRFTYRGENRFMVTHEDITGQKNCMEELVRQNRELTDFAFRISHDLKSPLNILLGYLEIARQEPEAFDFYYQRIVSQTEKMETFIRDLLKLSRAGRVLNERSSIDLNLLIQSIFSTCKPAELSANLILRSGLPVIEGDPEGIEEVFLNLIDNAMKYRDTNKNTLEIEIDSCLENGKHIIIIRDNGSGMSPRIIDRIFDAGFTISQKDGTGFGLPIARKIVEAHGGKINADSDGPGTGSIFTISLPADSNYTDFAPWLSRSPL